MNYLTSYSDLFTRIYITNDALAYPAAVRVKECLPELPVVDIDSKEHVPDEHKNASTLLITSSRGRVVSRCPGSKNHVCCNYLTVDLYLGCTIGCTYCIMRNYLNFDPVTVYVDTQVGIQAIRNIAEAHPDLVIRAGTGEVGDSLLLDPLFELSRDYIEGLSDVSNVYFELKTKTANVDHLLPIRSKGNCVIGFSLNPDKIIGEEEGCSAALPERLEAAAKAVESGYSVSFHFDPIIYSENWRGLYFPVVESLKRYPPSKVAWISLGTLRYPPKLKSHFEERPFSYQEFVPCADGKHRYIQKIRTGIYREMLKQLKLNCDAPVYLCMEGPAVWRNLFGSMPGRIAALQGLFRRPRGVD